MAPKITVLFYSTYGTNHGVAIEAARSAEAAGAEVLELNIDGDQAREIEAIDTYIARGVDAIVIAPLSADNSAAALMRARDAGIVVIALNGGLTLRKGLTYPPVIQKRLRNIYRHATYSHPIDSHMCHGER